MWSVRAGKKVMVGMRCRKVFVLRCERSWVLESKSGKEEQ